MEYPYRVDITSAEYIKKAVQSSLSFKLNPQDVHKQMMNIYWRLYENLLEENYLKFALEHLTAYITAGYDILGLEQITETEKVLEKAGYQSLYFYKKMIGHDAISHYVSLSRNRINSILGPGFVSKNRTGITKQIVIDEIIYLITNKKLGIYCYKIYYGDSILLTHLIINKKGIFMQDNSGNNYRFIDIFPPVNRS